MEMEQVHETGLDFLSALPENEQEGKESSKLTTQE
jgi:hypothetical protein